MARTMLQGIVALGAGVAATVALLGGRMGMRTAAAAVPLPSPSLDEVAGPAKGQQIAVFSGGCFWGVQAVFEHVKGVTNVASGYAGGSAGAASYGEVSTGTTGHAESVQITYDSSQISYGQLLKVFFAVAHNPTELNRQGPDHGPQYRSAIWYVNEDQKRVAQAYIDQLTTAKTFPKPIVTQVVALTSFYPAEAYHQDYAIHHPRDMYIMINDAPKVEALRQRLPELYRDKPVPYVAQTATP